MHALVQTDISYWLNNALGLITHPCHNFNGGFTKPPLKLRNGWVIISHWKLWGVINYPRPYLKRGSWSHQWHEVLNWKYISICILINETRGSVLSIARYNPHWGRVTHICVSKLNIICSDNGLSPGRRQAIIWTNAGMLLIGSLGTNFIEILIEILTFPSRKCVWKCRQRNGGYFVSATMS